MKGMKLKVGVVLALAFSAAAFAAASDLDRARELYHRTEYRQSLKVLKDMPRYGAPELQLIGQDYFQLAEYKMSTEALEKAVALDPQNPHIALWLGRAFGRRAETSNPLSAPGYASKA